MSLTPEQLRMRMNGIGSSEVPAICDLYPKTWKNRSTPESVLAEKLGEAEPWEGNPRTKKGERMEAIIARTWSEDTGRPVAKNSETFAHPELSWAMATPDYFAEDGDREILECKHVGHFVGKLWTPTPPPYVLAQVQWQMGVLGWDRTIILGWIEGRDELVCPFPVSFDPGVWKMLTEKVGAFWAHVLEVRKRHPAFAEVSNG